MLYYGPGRSAAHESLFRMTTLFHLPGREEIAALEVFTGLGMDCIHVVSSAAGAQSALDELAAAGAVGFDTESRPTFHKGQESQGPHVLQFATPRKAWVFQVHVEECLPALMQVLASEAISKIGFGLRSDTDNISRRFGIRPHAIIDLNARFRKMGYTKTIGAKQAVAMLFRQRMQKSKSTSTTNWSNHRLTERQILYAANDAYVAIRVFDALNALESRVPEPAAAVVSA